MRVTMTRMDVAERVATHRADLTPVDRRIADVLLGHPEAVAFGTVASVAADASTSTASVVRFAVKLGYPGFSALQQDVREDVSRDLRPATERIRRHAPSDVLEVSRAVEVANVEATLSAVTRPVLDRATDLLADPRRALVVLGGDAAAGVVAQVTTELRMIRPDVHPVGAGPVEAGRRLAHLSPGDVLLAVDLPRYDSTVLAATRLAREAGAAVLAVTDRPMSPLADGAEAAFAVHAEGVGPFDSYVGALALLNLLVAATAQRLQDSATGRLDRVEAAWTRLAALDDG